MFACWCEHFWDLWAILCCLLLALTPCSDAYLTFDHILYDCQNQTTVMMAETFWLFVKVTNDSQAVAPRIIWDIIRVTWLHSCKLLYACLLALP